MNRLEEYFSETLNGSESNAEGEPCRLCTTILVDPPAVYPETAKPPSAPEIENAIKKSFG